MILSHVTSGSKAATIHSTRQAPSGPAEENGRNVAQKGDFNGQMSFAQLPQTERMGMKYIVVLFMAIFGSCASNTGTGVIAGSLLGASLGGVTGGGGSAIIGGTAGVIAGGLLGAALDEQDRKVMERNSPRTVNRMDRNEPLTINDIIKLSQGGVSDETILGYMRDTSSYYHLSQAQVRRLQDAGVSEKVIHEMVASGQ